MSASEAYFVMRTVAALELLADAPRSTSEIADALLIHPRTARRMLARLVDTGYVRCQPGRRPLYSVTERFEALANGALRRS
jgi:DNA-binding IclR family transcriptional regulator